MARRKASIGHVPIPVFESGVIFVPYTIPNGVFTPYPPANGCPPARVWQEAQCPAVARASPRAIDSAEKLDWEGGSMGAMACRRDKSRTPPVPTKAITSIATPTRRIIASPLFYPSAVAPASSFGLRTYCTTAKLQKPRTERVSESAQLFADRLSGSTRADSSNSGLHETRSCSVNASFVSANLRTRVSKHGLRLAKAIAIIR